MRKQLLFLTLLLLCALYCNAAIITVSNNPNSPAQYSDLQTAIDAASVGDTIYVHGSTSSYGSINLEKRLVLIGAGYNPDNQFGLISELGKINLNIGTVSNPSGAKIMGFKISSLGNSSGGEGVDNVELIKNDIHTITLEGKSYDQTKYWIIRNNIISKIECSSHGKEWVSNCLMLNNIIYGWIYLFQGQDNLFSNNVLHNVNISSTVHAIFNNNVFYGTSTEGVDYCTFNNNISIGGTQTNFIYDHNTGGNNFVEVDPQFMNITSSSFSYDDDYRLKENSPGKNAGTDGTDIGIYGGSYPFPAFGDALYTGMPAIPQILEMNIMNSSLKVTDNLDVQIKAVKAQ